MKPRITNIWCGIRKDDSGNELSQIRVESTTPIEPVVESDVNGFNIKIPTPLGMPPGILYIADGLIRDVAVEEEKDEKASVRVRLDFKAQMQVEKTPGLPYKTSFILERSGLQEVFRGKTVVVDPGHGGDDSGSPGPVNLVEKNVVLLVGKCLEETLHHRNCSVLMTRIDDINIPVKERLALTEDKKAQAYIGLHTGARSNPRNGGFRVLFNSSFSGSQQLAEMVEREMAAKLKLRSRGVVSSESLARLGVLPGISVEVVTITNWVEEGLLRNPYFRERIALCIANGLTAYFSGKCQQASEQPASVLSMKFRPQRSVEAQCQEASSPLELISSRKRMTC